MVVGSHVGDRQVAEKAYLGLGLVMLFLRRVVMICEGCGVELCGGGEDVMVFEEEPDEMGELEDVVGLFCDECELDEGIFEEAVELGRSLFCVVGPCGSTNMGIFIFTQSPTEVDVGSNTSDLHKLGNGNTSSTNFTCLDIYICDCQMGLNNNMHFV